MFYVVHGQHELGLSPNLQLHRYHAVKDSPVSVDAALLLKHPSKRARLIAWKYLHSFSLNG